MSETKKESEKLRDQLTNKIREITHDPNTEKEILEKVANLEFLAQEKMWIDFKQKILTEIESIRTRDPKIWKLFISLANMPEQPRHVTEPEKGFMKELRRRHHFSISKLATIFSRSTETVSRQLEPLIG